MSKREVTIIRGDGIGPEVTDAATRVLLAVAPGLDFQYAQAGAGAVEKFNTALPEDTLDAIRRTGVCLKGPVTTPVGRGFTSVNVGIRKSLNLFAGVRRVRSIPGIDSPFSGVDLVVVRENTEGLYSGIEHEVVPGVVESLKIITEKASTRIAKFAFAYARREQRKRLTSIHKANIMKMSDGLFLKCARRIADDYPDIEYSEVIVDNASMQLVLNPHQFDVLLLENLYGDILSDLCAGLVGGLGVVPGANIGEDCAMFEAVHGSAPDIAGKNVANPTAVILSGALLLSYLGLHDEGERVYQAVLSVIGEGKCVTRDLGGTASTTEMTDAFVRQLAG